MYYDYFVDNFDYVTDQLSSGATIYLEDAALAALPDLSSDGLAAVVLVLDDGAGNYEPVEAYSKTSSYVTVSRDCFNLGYQPGSWPAGTRVRSLPLAVVAQTCQNNYHYEVSLSGATPLVQRSRFNYRTSVITLDQNATITFTYGTITTALSQRTGLCTVVIIQDSTGGWTYTFPTGIYWEGGAEPTPVTTANSVTVFEFMWLSTGQILGRRVISGSTPSA
jgi:hypothetical protein